MLKRLATRLVLNFRVVMLVITSFLLFLGVAFFKAEAQEDILSQLEEIAIIDQKIMMPMRDGIKLATDIYRPKTDQPVPVIFKRTPYNFNTWRDGQFNDRYYKLALQAVKKDTLM